MNVIAICAAILGVTCAIVCSVCGPSAKESAALKNDIETNKVILVNVKSEIESATSKVASINGDISESNRKVAILLREETDAKNRIAKLMQDEIVLKNLKVMEDKDNLADLTTSINVAQSSLTALHNQVSQLDIKAKELNAQINNRYVLHVQLKQSNISLSLTKHLKNAMNAEEFDIIVDKQAYDAAAVGSDLFQAFRVGSLLLKGSIGSWHLTVLSKRVIAP